MSDARAMGAGEQPRFGFYNNDETDFSGIQVEDALNEWGETRGRIVDYVRSLTDEDRSRVGFHERFGEITVERYLQVALDHDRSHLRDVERLAGGLTR